MDDLLGRFGWYRRLRGGHWEEWGFAAELLPRWVRMRCGCAHPYRASDPASAPAGAHGAPNCEQWS